MWVTKYRRITRPQNIIKKKVHEENSVLKYTETSVHRPVTRSQTRKMKHYTFTQIP